MQAFLEWCGNNVAICVTIVLALFEITPIKVHPLRWFLKWLGRQLTSDIKTQIANVDKKVDENKKENTNQIKEFRDEVNEKFSSLSQKTDGIENIVDLNEMDRIRWEILNFANSCRSGRLHTKDEFEHVITQEAKYRKLLEKTNTTNGVFEQEYIFILEIYRKCQRENSFLK